MAKHLASIGLAALLVCGVSVAETIHQQANACRLGFRSDCDSVCLVCHPPPESAPIDYPTSWNLQGTDMTEVYLELLDTSENSPPINTLAGDLALCIDCHTSKGDRGNHPVGNDYKSLAGKLVADPQGPKLQCTQSGGACKLACSTCHDPHSSKPRMLRLEKGLCIACHIK